MKYKIPILTYIVMLLFFLLITLCTLFIINDSLNMILVSIGAGGIASALVALILDIRNTRIRKIEDQRRYDEIINQFVRIYFRMMSSTAHVCSSFCDKEEYHSFQNWLSLLSLKSLSFPKQGLNSMERHCNGISGAIVSLQRQIESFQSQTTTLIFGDFPNLERTQQELELLWIHCWGTLKMLENKDYKGFCETTYILYTDFINAFPQYQNRFPAEYSIESIEKLSSTGVEGNNTKYK